MDDELKSLTEKADEVAGVLRELANEKRLLILCALARSGELSVGGLVETLSAAQPAVSQHLARMREEGIVAFRRDAQTLWYRIADERVARLLDALYGIYCAPATASAEAKSLTRA